MAVLSMNWTSPGRVAPPVQKAVVTPKEGEESKEGAEESAKSAPVKRAEKPMMVYVSDPSGGGESFDKVEKVVLTDDRVCVGSKAFTLIKMTPEQAGEDRLLSAAGKDVPRIVLVSADYQDVTVLEGGKLSVGDLWKAMQSHFRKAYEGDLEKNVKSLLKVMLEFDKLAKARTVQEDKEKRSEKPTAADKAEWAESKKDLDEREKKAEKERDALLAFEKKKLAA